MGHVTRSANPFTWHCISERERERERVMCTMCMCVRLVMALIYNFVTSAHCRLIISIRPWLMRLLRTGDFFLVITPLL